MACIRTPGGAAAPAAAGWGDEYRRVAGIRSTAPGYRTAMIEPDFEIGVDHVKAHLGTPYGELGVEWTRTAGAASVVVQVPHAVTAQLVTTAGAVALAPGRSTHTISLSGGQDASATDRPSE
jgi:alpha-L-rhamnosidase